MSTMMSVNLGDDLFADEAGVDEELSEMQAAPFMEVDGEDGPMQPTGALDEDGVAATQEESEEAITMLRDLSKGAAKKRVMRPQPKLDADRIQGKRGIAVLPEVFEKVKFKGHGHEGEDLQTLMKTLEGWAHRMMPKMTFDEVIERMEKLGSKKQTQTVVKKIRLGMPLLDEDFVNRNDIDAADRSDDERDTPQNQEQMELDAEEAYEAMLQEEQRKMQLNQPESSLTQSTNNTSSRKPDDLLTKAQPILNDEAIARMEHNKKMAMERRKARMKATAMTGNITDSSISSEPIDKASVVTDGELNQDNHQTDENSMQKKSDKNGAGEVSAGEDILDKSAVSTGDMNTEELHLELSQSGTSPINVTGTRIDGGHSSNANSGEEGTDQLNLQFSETATLTDQNTHCSDRLNSDQIEEDLTVVPPQATEEDLTVVPPQAIEEDLTVVPPQAIEEDLTVVPPQAIEEALDSSNEGLNLMLTESPRKTDCNAQNSASVNSMGTEFELKLSSSDNDGVSSVSDGVNHDSSTVFEERNVMSHEDSD